MWRIPLALIAGGTSEQVIFTSDTLVGNLWTFLGSPTAPKDYEIIVDNCDVGNLDITASFPGMSTFTIRCINGGRIIGTGGSGGSGGNDLGATGENGLPGNGGGDALFVDGFTIDIDLDDGFLLGGGGGGGGGSYRDDGATGEPGSGGGGGAGFGTSNGGAAGSSIGFPPGTPGTNGSSSAPGVGGVGITNGFTSGGDGGDFGEGGNSGASSNMISFSTFFLYGGAGGSAGSACLPVNGGGLNYIGVKDEATLRSERRIAGETTQIRANLGNLLSNNVSQAGSTNHGLQFQSDGDLIRTNTANDLPVASQWLTQTLVAAGANYDARIRNQFESNDQTGTWDFQPAAQGTWVNLATTRTWSFNSSSGIETRAALWELRRADDPNGNRLASILFVTTDENGV